MYIATVVLSFQCVMIMIRQRAPITLIVEEDKQEDFHEFQFSLGNIVTVAQPGVLSRHRKTAKIKTGRRKQ